MATVITVRPSGDWTVDEITDNPREFLPACYALIGNGCDFIQAVSLGDGMFLLMDEEPFRRTPIPPGNAPLVRVLRAMNIPPARIQGAVVFVGETPDQGDLAGLSTDQITDVSIAIGATALT